MERILSTPRPDWQKTVESQGFHFHTLNEEPYWDESVCYRFSAAEIDAVEKATYALDKMTLEAVDHVIEQGLFEEFQIPQEYVEWIKRSWERDELTIYGRFDFAFDGRGTPKLLEYNADTPTALLEAAVIQWHWFRDLHSGSDQFNSIHERLIEAWRTLGAGTAKAVYFTSLRGNIEDYMTVNYLRDTAIQAGLQTEYIAVEDIGWNAARRMFVDLQERPMEWVFKLYPWEWMLPERFGSNLLLETTRWLEAPWKMILSNKAILVILHELFPDSPYLLPASYEPLGDTYIRKPLQSREGANIAVVVNGETTLDTEGPYTGPCMYQQYQPLPDFSGNYPVIGSWMVNGYACGIGIREDTSRVTQNLSRFVPHIFTH
jgi:glutathionylspermidine synthase